MAEEVQMDIGETQRRASGHNRATNRSSMQGRKLPKHCHNRGDIEDSRGKKVSREFRRSEMFTMTSSTKKPADMSPREMEMFLEDCLSGITTSEASRCAIVHDLASEAGLARVRQLAEAEFSISYSVLKPMFNPHCILFLRIISDDNISQSLALENAIGTIYNVLYGPNGTRGIGFFWRIMTCLREMKDNGYIKDSLAYNLTSLVLLPLVKVLSSTLTFNQGAAIKTEFREILEDICSFWDSQVNTYEVVTIELGLMDEIILKIGDILCMGDKLVVSTAAKKPAPQLESYFPVDFPGSLSDLGPRHDNDHELISKVKILPTVSEISSDHRPDFLPTRDSFNVAGMHHQHGIFQLLDTQFRLLREDTSGQLRDAIRLVLDNWNLVAHGTDWGVKRKFLRNSSPTPLRVYYNARVKGIRQDTIKALDIDLEFDQIHRLKKMTPHKRKKYWSTSRALREGGAILALVDGESMENASVVFLQVSKRNINIRENNATPQDVCDLVNDKNRAMVMVHFLDVPSQQDLEGLISMANSGAAGLRPLLLLEFPSVQYRLFRGILTCLQNLHKDPRHIPLTRWLIPRCPQNLGEANLRDFDSRPAIIPPPRYLHNCILDLSCIPPSGDELGRHQNYNLLQFSTNQDPAVMSWNISENTSMDSGQAEAMISALMHEVSLIQGPPGTGKSYVGIQIAKCLLANSWSMNLGPILCVCYTDHALDQFLSELMKSGVSQIVRIGSRSAYPEIEALSLDNYKVSGRIPQIRGHGRKIASSKDSLTKLSNSVGRACQLIGSSQGEKLKEFLTARFPSQAECIYQGRLDANSDALDEWVDGDAPGDLEDSNGDRSIDELLSVEVWTLTKKERRRLYTYWCQRADVELAQNLEMLLQNHASQKHFHTDLFTQEQAQVFDQVDVVGVTTTGLANSPDLLRRLRARVLICEEAGEVLESHTITALLPSVEHLILIGDHQQLRPRISKSRLSTEYDRPGPKYNLDESLFERLANSRVKSTKNDQATPDAEEVVDGCLFPIVQLDHQRRMHPSISTLIRETIYPNLRDHVSTLCYPSVSGMKERLFWMDHQHVEDPTDPEEPMQSKTNTWEAEMVVAMVKHLCRQGRYKHGDIAVLTPYIAQLRLLSDMLENVVDLVIGENDMADLDGWDEIEEESNNKNGPQHPQMISKGKLSDRVRLATVDNFQGEEATVVIISLVRSNKYRNCGFLKSPNRINVLLSRAKHGMYIIGNATTSSSAPMWSSVIEMLEKSGNIGPSVQLQCSRHPNNEIYVDSPETFATRAPEGGCGEKCGMRLSCGHTCTFKCHSKGLHNAVKCMELCTKIRQCGHLCPLKCHSPCGQCNEIVPDVLLPCGHTTDIHCYERGNLKAVKCSQLITKRMPGCGHLVEVYCYQHLEKLQCMHSCDDLLPCGHACKNPCWSCRKTSTIKHGPCFTPCQRLFTTCSHTCTRSCHFGSPCPPCKRPCEARCVHSNCPRTCSDPCPPCAEICEWSCTHRQSRCNLPCAVPCDIAPCDHRCPEKLACGHQCPALCGEQCPDAAHCHACGSPANLEKTVDLIMFQKYREVDVNTNPLIFLSCGHFYTVASLDGNMSLHHHYEIDVRTGQITKPKSSPRAAGSIYRGCPECRTPLRGIHRYNRIMKKESLDESTRRFVTKAHRTYIGLVKAIEEQESRIQSERNGFIESWSTPAARDRTLEEVKTALRSYVSLQSRFQKRVDKFQISMKEEEQPFGRVNQLLASAAARSKERECDSPKVYESGIETGFQIRGQCLHLRLTWAILWNYGVVYNTASVDSRICSALRDTIARRIKGLITESRSVISASRAGKFLAQEVEAMLFLALFSLLFLNTGEPSDVSVKPHVVDKAQREVSTILEKCTSLHTSRPDILGYLKEDIERARMLFNGATFYCFVTTEEKQEVYKAMARQFSGTGHWYYCRNNHPFTIGECGLPMEEARCMQCGERVGGYSHDPLPGVRRAEDMDQQFGPSESNLAG